MDAPRLARLGLVVHPLREVRRALDALLGWSDEHDVDVVQVPAAGQGRQVAEPGDPAACDAILALGGDGTTLAAVQTAAAVGRPVMGVACGSVGALTAVTTDGLPDALDRMAAGDWERRFLPALAVGDGPLTGVNDVIILRQGASQVSAEVSVDGELFVRFAGDGLVVATPLGSSAYTLAVGGPLLAPGSSGMVLTPISPHGGCCPPLVVGAESRLTIELDPRLRRCAGRAGRSDPRPARAVCVARIRCRAQAPACHGGVVRRGGADARRPAAPARADGQRADTCARRPRPAAEWGGCW